MAKLANLRFATLPSPCRDPLKSFGFPGADRARKRFFSRRASSPPEKSPRVRRACRRTRLDMKGQRPLQISPENGGRPLTRRRASALRTSHKGMPLRRSESRKIPLPMDWSAAGFVYSVLWISITSVSPVFIETSMKVSFPGSVSPVKASLSRALKGRLTRLIPSEAA